MIRVLVARTFSDDPKLFVKMVGLSTDDKPLTMPIITGSKFTEVDTGDLYLYDEVAPAWHKVKEGYRAPAETPAEEG